MVARVAAAATAAAAASATAAAAADTTIVATADIGLLALDQLCEVSHGISEHFDLCCHGCNLRVFDSLRFVHVGG